MKLTPRERRAAPRDDDDDDTAPLAQQPQLMMSQTPFVAGEVRGGPNATKDSQQKKGPRRGSSSNASTQLSNNDGDGEAVGLTQEVPTNTTATTAALASAATEAAMATTPLPAMPLTQQEEETDGIGASSSDLFPSRAAHLSALVTNFTSSPSSSSPSSANPKQADLFAKWRRAPMLVGLIDKEQAADAASLLPTTAVRVEVCVRGLLTHGGSGSGGGAKAKKGGGNWGIEGGVPAPHQLSLLNHIASLCEDVDDATPATSVVSLTDPLPTVPTLFLNCYRRCRLCHRIVVAKNAAKHESSPLCEKNRLPLHVMSNANDACLSRIRVCGVQMDVDDVVGGITSISVGVGAAGGEDSKEFRLSQQLLASQSRPNTPAASVGGRSQSCVTSWYHLFHLAITTSAASNGTTPSLATTANGNPSPATSGVIILDAPFVRQFAMVVGIMEMFGGRYAYAHDPIAAPLTPALPIMAPNTTATHGKESEKPYLPRGRGRSPAAQASAAITDDTPTTSTLAAPTPSSSASVPNLTTSIALPSPSLSPHLAKLCKQWCALPIYYNIEDKDVGNGALRLGLLPLSRGEGCDWGALGEVYKGLVGLAGDEEGGKMKKGPSTTSATAAALKCVVAPYSPHPLVCAEDVVEAARFYPLLDRCGDGVAKSSANKKAGGKKAETGTNIAAGIDMSVPTEAIDLSNATTYKARTELMTTSCTTARRVSDTITAAHSAYAPVTSQRCCYMCGAMVVYRNYSRHERGDACTAAAANKTLAAFMATLKVRDVKHRLFANGIKATPTAAEEKVIRACVEAGLPYVLLVEAKASCEELDAAKKSIPIKAADAPEPTTNATTAGRKRGRDEAASDAAENHMPKTANAESTSTSSSSTSPPPPTAAEKKALIAAQKEADRVAKEAEKALKKQEAADALQKQRDEALAAKALAKATAAEEKRLQQLKEQSAAEERYINAVVAQFIPSEITPAGRGTSLATPSSAPTTTSSTIPSIRCFAPCYASTEVNGIPFLLGTDLCGVVFKDTSCITVTTGGVITYVNRYRHRFSLHPPTKDHRLTIPQRIEKKVMAVLWVREVFAHQEHARGALGFVDVAPMGVRVVVGEVAEGSTNGDDEAAAGINATTAFAAHGTDAAAKVTYPNGAAGVVDPSLLSIPNHTQQTVYTHCRTTAAASSAGGAKGLSTFITHRAFLAGCAERKQCPIAALAARAKGDGYGACGGVIATHDPCGEGPGRCTHAPPNGGGSRLTLPPALADTLPPLPIYIDGVEGVAGWGSSSGGGVSPHSSTITFTIANNSSLYPSKVYYDSDVDE